MCVLRRSQQKYLMRSLIYLNCVHKQLNNNPCAVWHSEVLYFPQTVMLVNFTKLPISLNILLRYFG